MKFLTFTFLFFACLHIQAQDVFFTKPYLQIGYHSAPNRLSLLWHTTDTTAQWMVEYKNAGESTWLKADSMFYNTVAVQGTTLHRVYHAGLSRLNPGTTFTYRVKANGKTVFQSEGKSIHGSGQKYRMGVFGDIGAETPEQKALATQLFKEKPDMIAVAGDIVYEAGLVPEYRSKFWPIYNNDKPDTAGAPLMRSIPWVAAVGNHDADSHDLDRHPDALAYYMYWEQPLNGPELTEGGAGLPVMKGSDAHKSAFHTAAGAAYPNMTNFSFDYGNGHWTVLDADTYMNWTDSTMKAWVAKDLAASASATWHFVLFHHPGFNSSIEHFEQQQMRLLAPIFEKGKVDIVFTGHVHNYQRSYPLHFQPARNGTLMMSNDAKTPRGRVVPGLVTLDKQFDGEHTTRPDGVIYIVTGAGGNDLYNPEQETKPDTWQKFTTKFISNGSLLHYC